jgi:hypothetical protein
VSTVCYGGTTTGILRRKLLEKFIGIVSDVFYLVNAYIFHVTTKMGTVGPSTILKRIHQTVWCHIWEDHNVNIHCQCCTRLVLTTKCMTNLKGVIFAASEDSPSLRVQDCYWLLVGSRCVQLNAAQILVTAFTIHNGFPVNDWPCASTPHMSCKSSQQTRCELVHF